MPLTTEDYNVLGSVIDSSFANSSANQKGYYVKVKFAGTKSDSRQTSPDFSKRVFHVSESRSLI